MQQQGQTLQAGSVMEKGQVADVPQMCSTRLT